MKEKILGREKACFDFLIEIPINRRYVLIGGYAISAFDFPRLSVDLDIVIPEKELAFFEKLAIKQGFRLSTEKSDVDETYSGRFRRYVKGGELPVSVDLLINSVSARQTGISYPFNYILKNSEVKEITGWHPQHKAKVRIADKEMLIALKINSMRLPDRRDIIVLCYESPSVEKILNHLFRCPKAMIGKHLKILLELINDPRYIDSVKGIFGISDDVYTKTIRNSKRLIKELEKGL